MPSEVELLEVFRLAEGGGEAGPVQSRAGACRAG